MKKQNSKFRIVHRRFFPSSPNTQRLFSYDSMSKQETSYPASQLKLSHVQLSQWLKSKLPDSQEEAVDDSVHDIIAEEEERDKSRGAIKLNTPATTGAVAIKSFFDKFKGLHSNASQSPSMRSSASYRYLQKIDKIKGIPHPMGIVKWKGTNTELDLTSHKMGDRFAHALGKGLKHMSPESVHISDNRLTRVGYHSILKHLKPSVKFMDLSMNVLNDDAPAALGKYVKLNNSLQLLNLENTKLGDKGAIRLCELIQEHQRLAELNLAKNNLSDVSAEVIALKRSR